MILLDAGQRDSKTLDSRILFAAKLAARGHPVALDQATITEPMYRSQKYEAATLLADTADLDISGVIVIGAETIGPKVLKTLRNYGLSAGTPVTGIGAFEDAQARIGARSKLAYALGWEPQLLDTATLQPRPLLTSAIAPLAASDCGPRAPSDLPDVFVFVPVDLLEDPLTLPLLGALHQSAHFRLNVLTTGRGKALILRSRFTALRVYGYTELPPSTLAQLADVVVFFGDGIPGERMAVFALDLMRSGGAVIDSTVSAAFAGSGAPALRGPQDLTALAPYLDASILRNLAPIGAQSREAPWLHPVAIETLERALGLPVPPAPPAPARPPRTLFMPTNGNGLGHAQRCLQIAAAMKAPDRCTFATFPSCGPLVADRGFATLPLVQRSAHHEDEYANDLMNALRLNRALAPGDHVVFDGGFVFESVYRTIVQKGLRGTWIRRGLWQATQSNQTALDREKAFQQVIVPQEAFDELNVDYSFGPHLHHVGPIVQVAQGVKPDAARTALAARLGRPFERLVVTMLGAGVAADRTAQLQTLCSRFDQQADCLHVVVVWPGARVAPALFSWKNTVVVKTRQALTLWQAADFVISAVGYNSFHEALYNRIPAIFIPQTAAYMDDQERRARAASDRGLAATVLAPDLILLEREVAAFLDGKAGVVRATLEATTLPARGNGAAAHLIEGGAP